jgi:hypothetical protein
MTHPITPPSELVKQWRAELPSGVYDGYKYPQRETELCIQAAQWGADQELNECCEFLLLWYNGRAAVELVNKRRPKLPTLKEQALAILATAGGPDYPTQMTVLNTDEHIFIKRALEALPQ